MRQIPGRILIECDQAIVLDNIKSLESVLNIRLETLETALKNLNQGTHVVPIQRDRVRDVRLGDVALLGDVSQVPTRETGECEQSEEGANDRTNALMSSFRVGGLKTNTALPDLFLTQRR